MHLIDNICLLLNNPMFDIKSSTKLPCMFISNQVLSLDFENACLKTAIIYLTYWDKAYYH